MHELKHLVVILPGVVFDTVKRQRMGSAATALIQRRDEPGLALHLLHLLGRSHGWFPRGYALSPSVDVARVYTAPAPTPGAGHERMREVALPLGLRSPPGAPPTGRRYLILLADHHPASI